MISCFVLCMVIQVYPQGCSIKVDMLRGQKKPVFVDERDKLVIPQNGQINVVPNGIIKLLCPNDNTFTIERTNLLQAICISGTTFRILQKNQDIRSLECAKPVKGDATNTRTTCGGQQGNIIILGFQMNNINLQIVEVCYSNSRGIPLYSGHELLGRLVASFQKTDRLSSFQTTLLNGQIDANMVFKKENEMANFNKLLGTTQNINTNSYLAKGHLAPTGDFPFNSWQSATFFYVNVAPQWQSINNGNWKIIENLSRDTAKYYNNTLQVYTGTHDVLELTHANGSKIKMFMVPDKMLLPIPKFIWKILYLETAKKAIAFISLNNPFAKTLATTDKLCTDVCDRYGWKRAASTDGSKGFIYCCDVRDFLQGVQTAPRITVNGILESPR
ncbi:hypothetical protein HHI36_016353 [Cryptolaemus montrouzieri]|uniref:DNA/RNA non-specific endonuclease domain-containing protein n=1 Tax=Cryptolaemus montrouzieri TaxID=559131 RepID=A0ABD2NJL7_9CUCU